MGLKEFRKKYQGKYFFYSSPVSLQYFYLKKVRNADMFGDKIFFSCFLDLLYVPVEGQPVYWKDFVNFKDSFMCNTRRISKTEFHNKLKQYGIQRVQEEIPR